MRLPPLCTAVPLLVWALFLAGPAAAQTRVQFDFHSGFLLNLHHFLFDLAVHPAKLDGLDTLPAPDAQTLRQATVFYRDHYAGRDLLFDDPMPAIKHALSLPDDARRDPAGLALPPGLADVLRAAAPVYAARLWPAQDAVNRGWIAQVRVLDARYGADVQAAVERGLASRYPARPLRIDVVVETGKRQGAYTDDQTVIPAGRASYGGLAALEMLYHEAAHVQSADALQAAIARKLKAAGKPDESELWHVLQFQTVGAAVAAVVRQRDGIDYTPYAEKAGLMRGPWAGFQPLIDADWTPYLAGRESLDAALTHMVARLE
jgi:hypothetical protein